MGLLTGKTAIITGAARGIGKAIALKFASEGANIAFTDLVIDENGKNTEAEIAAFGVKVKGYASNAASFEETAKVVEQIHADFGDAAVFNGNVSHPLNVIERINNRGAFEQQIPHNELLLTERFDLAGNSRLNNLSLASSKGKLIPFKTNQ